MYLGYNGDKGETYLKCECCGKEWIVDDDDPDIWLEPWPHIVCPICGTWIANF